MGVSKNWGKKQKMDGSFHRKPYQQMYDLGGKLPLFLEGHTHLHFPKSWSCGSLSSGSSLSSEPLTSCRMGLVLDTDVVEADVLELKVHVVVMVCSS